MFESLFRSCIVEIQLITSMPCTCSRCFSLACRESGQKSL